MEGYSQADKEGTLLIDETQIKGSLVINGNGNPIGFVDFDLVDLTEIFKGEFVAFYGRTHSRI
ncbi:MAG TPA: hypothetical protein VHA52_13135 [Candidatus Babeliaceae bacterium]|nr:hypothetical protein [Candidatus Babeliaceae bacterium]